VCVEELTRVVGQNVSLGSSVRHLVVTASAVKGMRFKCFERPSLTKGKAIYCIRTSFLLN